MLTCHARQIYIFFFSDCDYVIYTKKQNKTTNNNKTKKLINSATVATETHMRWNNSATRQISWKALFWRLSWSWSSLKLPTTMLCMYLRTILHHGIHRMERSCRSRTLGPGTVSTACWASWTPSSAALAPSSQSLRRPPETAMSSSEPLLYYHALQHYLFFTCICYGPWAFICKAIHKGNVGV